MTLHGALPDGLEHVRTAGDFDEATVPPGLLRAHRVAAGNWARLVVSEGELGFVFEDEPGAGVRVGAGDWVVIPPERPHRLEIGGPVRFAVEFHRGG